MLLSKKYIYIHNQYDISPFASCDVFQVERVIDQIEFKFFQY